MQQALYNSFSSMTNLCAQKWEMYGVLTLLASCATYGVLALGQVA